MTCCPTTSEIKSVYSEKPVITEWGDVIYLKTGITEHIFRQSLQEDFHNVALGSMKSSTNSFATDETNEGCRSYPTIQHTLWTVVYWLIKYSRRQP